MLEKIRQIGGRLFGWIIPAVLAVLTVQAINKAAHRKAKQNRVERELSNQIDAEIAGRAADINAAHTKLQAAKDQTRAANDKAKQRLDRLASTSESMADSLDRYRRDRGLQHSSDAT